MLVKQVIGALDSSQNLADIASVSAARTNLGLGSIATQSAGNVAIIGGTINATTIGATAQAPGTFGDTGAGNASLTLRSQVGSPTNSAAFHLSNVTPTATNYVARFSTAGGVVLNPQGTGQLSIMTNVQLQWTSSGVMIGATAGTYASSTAKLQLGAGTATAGSAPLKVNAGSLLTTPEAGAFEVDANGAPYWTKTTTRNQFALQGQNNTFTQATLGGSFGVPFWNINGVGLIAQSATYTDTTSSGASVGGTIGIHAFAIPTMAAANASSYTGNVSTIYVAGPPVAGANVTFLNTQYGVNIDAGGLRAIGNTIINNQGASQTSIGTGTATGLVAIGGGSNTVRFGSTTQLLGNFSAPSWNTNGVGLVGVVSTYTDTSSSGTNGNQQAVHALAVPTIAAASATTYSNNVATVYIAGAPVAGANATFNGTTYALNINNGGARVVGGTLVSGNTNINPNAGANITQIGTGTTTGAVTIGGSSNVTNLQSATVALTGVLTRASFTVATLPSAPAVGSVVRASNGRKAGEASGAGTGVNVVYDYAPNGTSLAWRDPTNNYAAVAA